MHSRLPLAAGTQSAPAIGTKRCLMMACLRRIWSLVSGLRFRGHITISETRWDGPAEAVHNITKHLAEFVQMEKQYWHILD